MFCLFRRKTKSLGTVQLHDMANVNLYRRSRLSAMDDDNSMMSFNCTNFLNPFSHNKKFVSLCCSLVFFFLFCTISESSKTVSQWINLIEKAKQSICIWRFPPRSSDPFCGCVVNMNAFKIITIYTSIDGWLVTRLVYGLHFYSLLCPTLIPVHINIFRGGWGWGDVENLQTHKYN